MRKFTMNIIVLVLILLAAACSGQGGTSGSVHGSSGSYYVNDEGGHAEVNYDGIKGTYYESYEISIKNDDVVAVEVKASVGQGRVRVFLKGPQDEISQVVISPGQPGTLSGLAAVWSDETFHIYFEALDGEAGDISYTVQYTY